MKRVFFICVATLIIFILTMYSENKKKSKVNFSYLNYSTYEYECKYEETECRVYFIPYYDIYIQSFKNNNYKDNALFYNNYYAYHFYKNKNYYYKNNKITIDDKITITKKLEFEYDYKLNGEYSYNNEYYTFNNGKLNSSITSKSSKPFTTISQLDKDIIYLSEAIISEIPIYKYEFDKENNLILYPIVSRTTHMDKRLSYKLKRLN